MEPTDPLIDGVWESGPAPQTHLILPDGCVDVVARPGGLVVVGPMRTARSVRLGGAPQRGIRFVPGAVRAWLGESPAALVDRVVPLADLPAVSHVTSLEQVIARARGVRPCARIQEAIRSLRASPTCLGGLAARLGWSERHLRRRIREEVGISPARLARIFRLQRLVRRLSSPDTLGDLAYSLGFSDQAHLSREVRALTGEPPATLRRRMSVLCKPPPRRGE